MRTFGFSTGALAKGDFRKAKALSDHFRPRAIEYSALRGDELVPLTKYLLQNGPGDYDHVSLHAPSKFGREEEPAVVQLLEQLSHYIGHLFIIVHPDTIKDFNLWRRLGNNLCVENMDHRKPGGRSVEELSWVFSKLPDARLCFDIGHAHEVDRSMSVGYSILQHFGSRIAQVHASEVTDTCAHRAFSASSEFAFAKVAGLIPECAPVILEVVVPKDRLGHQLAVAKHLFGS